MTRCTPHDVYQAIAAAFAGVSLGSGISIRQTQVIDRFGDGYTPAAFAALPSTEVIDDWARIDDVELEKLAVAHLNAEGYRYYIAALAISVLRHYHLSSMRVTSTLYVQRALANYWSAYLNRDAA